jgi:hypothetical protein
VDGKTVSETFSSPAELRKAQREVEAFHRFRELSSQLLKLNEQICRLRPVEETLTLQKKTAQAVQQEVTREVGQVLVPSSANAADRTAGLGSHREGGALGQAPGRRSGWDGTAAV